jgi:hypothetical protein
MFIPVELNLSCSETLFHHQIFKSSSPSLLSPSSLPNVHAQPSGASPAGTRKILRGFKSPWRMNSSSHQSHQGCQGRLQGEGTHHGKGVITLTLYVRGLEFGQKSWDVDGSEWHWYLDIFAHSSSGKSKLSWIRRRATTLPPTLHRIIQGPRGDISDLQIHVCVSDPKERLNPAAVMVPLCPLKS